METIKVIATRAFNSLSYGAHAVQPSMDSLVVQQLGRFASYNLIRIPKLIVATT